MITPLDIITIADGGTISVAAPDDGGVQIEVRPFSNGPATPAVATLNLEHARRLAGLLNAAIGWQESRMRETQLDAVT